MLYDTPLPWVDSWKHLGYTIHKDESSEHDILVKRAEFIGKVHSLRQEIGAVDLKVFLTLTQIYMSSFYGSSLWNLTSQSARKLYSSWNLMIQHTYNLPFGTHRFILKELSNLPPLQETLEKRFTKFCNQIENCGKPEIVHLFNKQKFDSRSTFGKNYKNILVYKNEITDYKTPEMDTWKIPFIMELLDIRDNHAEVVNMSTDDVKAILTELSCK